ncbi:Molybdopterin converting factor, small subunit [Verrucomicrobium sp. GAS474]|uniref:MoaD/ThiS family protein n=1 Tax=Verrucomicrobium sp. GAS474 TaxID=1882831 RepID=UPI000879236A|nr:MoaD/ThiS family protein [Verrucomicrobium sp. GAS474]SDU25668.1 Molybdopterin converting factor, small subunit [Verrucomicrobium sp. GAS474]
MRLLAFARARDILGSSEIEAALLPGDTPSTFLDRHFPQARLSLPRGTRPALDQEYIEWDASIPETARELAILPPVSGG